MTIPADTLEKMQDMTQEKLNIVITLVDQLSKSPEQVLAELRQEGLKNPMSDDEIDDFIKNVRSERHAVSA